MSGTSPAPGVGCSDWFGSSCPAPTREQLATVNPRETHATGGAASAHARTGSRPHRTPPRLTPREAVTRGAWSDKAERPSSAAPGAVRRANPQEPVTPPVSAAATGSARPRGTPTPEHPATERTRERSRPPRLSAASGTPPPTPAHDSRPVPLVRREPNGRAQPHRGQYSRKPARNQSRPRCRLQRLVRLVVASGPPATRSPRSTPARSTPSGEAASADTPRDLSPHRAPLGLTPRGAATRFP